MNIKKLSAMIGIVFFAASLSSTVNAEDAAVRLLDHGDRSFVLKTGAYDVRYDVTQKNAKGWITFGREGYDDVAIGTMLANGEGLNITAPGTGEGEIYRWDRPRKDSDMFRSLTCTDKEETIEIIIKSERQWASFEASLIAYKAYPGLVHWTVKATAKEDRAFSGHSTPDCHFMRGDKATEWEQIVTHPVVRYSVQRGPGGGIVYFQDKAMDSLVFYFEDFSSMNDLYRLTRCENPYDYPKPGNPGSVKLGEPKHWFQMSSPDGENVQPMKPYEPVVEHYDRFGYYRPCSYRVPAGETLVLGDTYLYLQPAVKMDNAGICRRFVEMLATIYPYIYKPPMIKTDWAGHVVPQMVTDIMRPENTGVARETHLIPRAYVGYEHEDNQLWTVLNLLHPLELYVRKFPEQKAAKELYGRLNDCLPLYFDKDWGGFHNTLAPIDQDQYHTVVYIYSQAVMMADLARLGNTNAYQMITDFRDTLLRMGKAYDYVMADIWLRDFSKQKTYYQADSTCCYIYVMMTLYDLSGGKDKDCLEAAKAAADKLSERCMDLMWEANMTAAGIPACEWLYQATGEEKYRELAFIPLANVLREAWLWECDYGIGEKTTNFWAFSGCPAAPCTAEFENHRTRLHFKDYAAQAKDYLHKNVTYMLNDAWRRGPTQSRFTLPPLIIEAGAKWILPTEGWKQTNCGEIRYDQMIPLEDYRVGWGTDIEWWQNNAKPGVVGQEIYGAGGPIWYALWQDEL